MVMSEMRVLESGLPPVYTGAGFTSMCQDTVGTSCARMLKINAAFTVDKVAAFMFDIAFHC